MTEPSRRDRTRPAELIGLSGVLAVVAGIIFFFGTRNFALALEVAGGAFIVALVVFAMLLLAITPRKGRDDDQPPSQH